MKTMMLQIDSARLRVLLKRRREHIGLGPVAAHLVAVVEGLFLILTSLTTSMGYWWRFWFTVLAVLATTYAVTSAIIALKTGYNADKLYEELIDLDRTEKHSSIIAINDGNRYLLYHDISWNCDFFPNHATNPNETENIRLLTDYLSNGYGIPRNDFALERIAEETHEKYSTEHDEQRVYDYTLYKAIIHRMPEVWSHDQFRIEGKDCRWLTIDQMLNDPHISEINADVIGMVKTLL